jgi:hypothetical protein
MSGASQAGEVFLGAPEHFKDFWNSFKAGLSEKHGHLLMFVHRVEADQPGITPEERDFGYGLAASAESIWLSKILSTTDFRSWSKGQEIEHELHQLELQAGAETGDDDDEEAGARSEAGSVTPVSAATSAAIARVNKAVAMHIAGAELAMYDRLIKCLSKLVVNARFKLLQSMLVKDKGTRAIQALLSFYGGISKEMAANIYAKAFGKIDQARSLDQHCATSMNMQEAIVDMGSALHGLSLEQVAALYQLYIMKAFGDPATINIATKHLGAFTEGTAISLADLGSDIQLSKVFADGVRGQQVPGLMGAATSVPRQVLGNFSPPVTTPRVNYPPGSLEPCRMCAAKGIDFRCKASEWREHAKIAHPRPPRTNPRGSGGGAPSLTRQPFIRRTAGPTLAALQAHIDTLDPSVEIFALSGTIFQIVGDEVVTIGTSASAGVNGDANVTVPALSTRVTFQERRSTVQLAYVDSGAGRVITNDVRGAHGALQPSKLRVRSATGITAPVQTGIYALRTQTWDGMPCTLRFPDSLFSSEVGSTLISYNELLRLGFIVTLLESGGTVTSPEGVTIRLDKKPDGLWAFPPPAEVPSSTWQQPRRSGRVLKGSDTKGIRTVECYPSLVIDEPSMAEEDEETQGESTRPESQGESQGEPVAAMLGERTGKKLNTIRQVRDALRWHRTLNHPNSRRLLRMSRKGQSGVPTTLSPRVIRELRCVDCDMMKPQRLPARIAKPRRGVLIIDGAQLLPPSVKVAIPVSVGSRGHQPGEMYHLDFLGQQDLPPAFGGFVDALVMTDDESGTRWAHPVRDKKALTIVARLQKQQNAQVVKIKILRSDQELRSEELTAWADANGTLLTWSPREEAASNGRSEASVRVTKEGGRVLRSTAGGDIRLRALAWKHSCLMSNQQESASDPDREGRAPSDIWPDAPFQNRSLKRAPFGCRAFAFHGKGEGDNTNGARAMAGVFVGYSDDSPTYVVFNPDTEELRECSQIKFNEHVFPLRDLLGAGEHMPSDGAFDIDGWRRHAPLKIVNATDAQLAVFCQGKQVLVRLPQVCTTTGVSGRLLARCHRAITNRDQKKTTAIDVEMVSFSGDAALLNKTESRGALLKLQVSSGYARHAVGKHDASTCLRAIISEDYPEAITLADLAHFSADRHGMPSRAEAVEEERLPYDKALVKTRGRDLKRRAHGEPLAAMPGSAQGEPPAGLRGSRLRRQTVLTNIQAALSQVEEECKIPRNWKEAEADPAWRASRAREIDGLRERGAFVDVRRCDLPPGTRALPTIMVYDYKKVVGPGGFHEKSRCVLDGSKQFPMPDRQDRYAGTPSSAAIRMLLALASQSGRRLRKCDITQAFLQADPFSEEQHVYAIPPPGVREGPDHFWRILRPVYGLASSAKDWHDTFTKFLSSYGFKPVAFEDSLYRYTAPGVDLHVVFHVDDILISSDNDSAADKFITTMLERFQGREESPDSYLGLCIHHDLTTGVLTLDQESFVLELLRDQQMLTCTPCATPMIPETCLLEEDRPLHVDMELRTRYQAVTGSLQYLAQWTRPDLGFVCCQLAKHLQNPGAVHMAAAKHALRYLRGTSTQGLTYRRDGLQAPNQLFGLEQVTELSGAQAREMLGFVDSDWASDPDSRRSIGGYVFLLNGAAISWKCGKQPCVAHSSAEGEFMAASKASIEAVWLRRLLTGLGHAPSGPTHVFEDNEACIMMSDSAVHKNRSKHIDLRIWSLKEQVATGVVRLLSCPTAHMHADIFTKALPSWTFALHRSVLCGDAPPSVQVPRTVEVPRALKLRALSAKAA